MHNHFCTMVKLHFNKMKFILEVNWRWSLKRIISGGDKKGYKTEAEKVYLPTSCECSRQNKPPLSELVCIPIAQKTSRIMPCFTSEPLRQRESVVPITRGKNLQCLWNLYESCCSCLLKKSVRKKNYCMNILASEVLSV